MEFSRFTSEVEWFLFLFVITLLIKEFMITFRFSLEFMASKNWFINKTFSTRNPVSKLTKKQF